AAAAGYLGRPLVPRTAARAARRGLGGGGPGARGARCRRGLPQADAGDSGTRRELIHLSHDKRTISEVIAGRDAR
ncbi:MAG TPA: hypothetical protein VFP65_05825, partial [Anaeromyxobacteraceae bacterium]|nr:hypothetical protein [Anaeromyxobacteraceae bacterium]